MEFNWLAILGLEISVDRLIMSSCFAATHDHDHTPHKTMRNVKSFFIYIFLKNNVIINFFFKEI
jgi:hypothetical protein